jgi:hypothetical protein
MAHAVSVQELPPLPRPIDSTDQQTEAKEDSDEFQQETPRQGEDLARRCMDRVQYKLGACPEIDSENASDTMMSFAADFANWNRPSRTDISVWRSRSGEMRDNLGASLSWREHETPLRNQHNAKQERRARRGSQA